MDNPKKLATYKTKTKKIRSQHNVLHNTMHKQTQIT